MSQVATNERTTNALRIDIWSDVACPWCWVGKRHLEAALKQFEHPVRLHWHAFQLDASSPRVHDPEVDLVQRLADKYGTNRAGADAMIERMATVGASAGLDFRFDRVQPTNTFDAHRLIHWADRFDAQDAVKEALFVAYMHQGRSVADHDVLVDVAESVGLSADGATAMLNTDEGADSVREDQRVAAGLGVTGVPFFAIAERYAIPGAQPTDVLLGALERAAAESGPAPVIEAAAGCDADGCAVGEPA